MKCWLRRFSLFTCWVDDWKDRSSRGRLRSSDVARRPFFLFYRHRSELMEREKLSRRERVVDENQMGEGGRSRTIALLLIQRRVMTLEGSSGTLNRRRTGGRTRTNHYDALCTVKSSSVWQLVPTLDKAFQGPPQ